VGKEKNKTISSPHLILCEGEDTTLFIIYYLKHLRNRESGFEDFLALNFGGNEELPTFLSDLPNYPGYDIAESMTIIRDSEKDHQGSIQAVQSALKNAGFPVPAKPNTVARNNEMKAAFSLFPSLSENDLNGALEDLLINILKENGAKNLLNDIQFFLGDLKSKGRSFKWLHKSKLHTYFSVTNDFVAKKIGEATEAGAFDLECTEMNSLKELLTNITLK